MMIFNHQMSKEDYTAANRVYVRKISKHGRQKIRNLALSGILLLFLSILSFARRFPINNPIVTCFVLALAILILFEAYIFPDTQSKSWSEMKENRSAFLKNVWTIDKEGIQSDSEDGTNGFIVWERVNDTYETDSFFIIKLLESQILIISKHQLTALKSDELAILIKRYSKKGIIKI